MNIEGIAKICHAANKGYCESILDNSQPHWFGASQWQKDSAIEGVKFLLENPDAGPDATHQSWIEKKLGDGWKHGPVKNADTKEHPCIVPYDQLPDAQKVKDKLFLSIVNALRDSVQSGL